MKTQLVVNIASKKIHISCSLKILLTFQDINECLQWDICSQRCINTPGSYKCECVKKFKLNNDSQTCQVSDGKEGLMVFAARSSIFMVTLTSRHSSEIKSNNDRVVGVTYDGTFIYWTDVFITKESIKKAREDGTEYRTLFTAGLASPEDIAVDWITSNLYFTDFEFMHIAVCSNDGAHCSALVNEDVHRPRGIALYPQEGRMYWSDWGKKPMIAVANMDGTNAHPLVTDDIHWPNGVTLDWPNERIYWVDAKLKKIDSIKFDGTGRKVILDNISKNPYGIAVFENSIYWSDSKSSKGIQSCNKFTCKERKTIVRERRIYGKLSKRPFGIKPNE